MLTKADLTFLGKYTKLSQKKIKLLTEEPQDLALILDVLTTAKITKEELLSLSFEVIIKYIVFRLSHNLNYPITEKIYVCDMISRHFPYISRSKKLKPLPKDYNKDFAEYTFVLLGLFDHRLDQKEKFKYSHHLKYFRDCTESGVYTHLKEWFQICTQIKTQEIFV